MEYLKNDNWLVVSYRIPKYFNSDLWWKMMKTVK